MCENCEARYHGTRNEGREMVALDTSGRNQLRLPASFLIRSLCAVWWVCGS